MGFRGPRLCRPFFLTTKRPSEGLEKNEMSKHRSEDETMRDAEKAAQWIVAKMEAGEEAGVVELADAMGNNRRTVMRDLEHLIELLISN